MTDENQAGQTVVEPTAEPVVAAPVATSGEVVEITSVQPVEATTTAADAFTLQNIKRRYFAPDELETAQAEIGKVLAVCPQNMFRSNFDLADEKVPDGYGVAIVPISQRQKVGEDQKTVVLGATVALVPSPQVIMADDAGMDFVRDTLVDVCVAKIANAVRPKDGVLDADLFIPKTLEHFITVQKKGEGLKTFNELAPRVIKAMKEKTKGAMQFLTPQILRQVLQNSGWASHTFPNIPDTSWERVLEMMIKLATAEKLDTNILESWKSSRNEAAMAEVDADDFESAIASLE